jgi:FtsP/CotA-like multicopper oxidase with cupredoxin domain
MMPGERYEIIVDFADPVWQGLLAAKGVTFPLNLVLRNTAPTVIGNPNANTDGRIMQFRVSATKPLSDTSYDPASGIPIRSGAQTIVRLVNPATGALAAGVTANKTRELTLNEVLGAGGPLEVLVNNSKWMGMRPDGTPISGSTFVYPNFLTELPTEGETEVWEIVNMTMDRHPIHLHGLQFQLMNRQNIDMAGYMMAYDAAFPGSATIIDPMTGLPYAPGMFIPGYGPPLDYATGNPRALGGNPDITPFLLGTATPPLSYEAGWKDTVIMPSGQVTRIAVRIAPQDKAINGTDLFWTYQPNALNGVYVWHCHITDHEDNEMMRPDMFLPNPAAIRTYIQGIDF